MKVARAAWPVVVGLLVGLAAGAVWTLLQPDRFRAETRVQVRGDARGLVPAVKALAESSLLAQNVAQTLRLGGTPHVSAAGGTGGVLTLSTEAGSSERARQVDGEAAIVLARLVPQRFGTGAEVTVLDPAHTVEQTSPTADRNLLVTGLIGLLGGLAAAVALQRRRPPEPVVVVAEPDPAVERRLQARIDSVTKRERAMARRAGELAEREGRVREQEEELDAARKGAIEAAEAEAQAARRAVAEAAQAELEAARQAAIEDVEAELEAMRHTAIEAAKPEPEPEPEAEPEPELLAESVAERPMLPPRTLGRWTIDDLEQVVRANQDADPAERSEWMTYLFLLREHASVDGTLPASFDPLVNEIFGRLLR